MLDICICNGTIVDGSGQKPIISDVGIRDGRIVNLGDLSTISRKQTIDATGQIVCPGFIDVHTHTDAVLGIDARSMSQVRQGVTTQVVGLCGNSLAPLNDRAEERIKTMNWFNTKTPWRSYGEYLDYLESTKPGTNIGGFVGHGILRCMVMDNPNAPATSQELAHMSAILDEALQQGAFGLSTGLEYNPGKASESNELAMLCQVVQKHNAIHACHPRNRDLYYLSALAEVIDITRNTGARLQISHINPKYGRRDSTMLELLSLIQETRDLGFDVAFDIMPTEWNHTSATALLPLWAHALTLDELNHMLNTSDGRFRLRENSTPLWQLVKENKWDRIYLFGGDKTLAYVGMDIQSLAETWKCSAWDAFCRLLHMEYPNFGSMIVCSNAFELNDIRMALTDPFSSVASDALGLATDGPLAGRSFSPNTYNWVHKFFSSFLLSHQPLPIEVGIRKLTSIAAKQMGLSDRGLLSLEYKADVVVLALDKMQSNVTLEQSLHYSEGISTVIINGGIAYSAQNENIGRFGSVLRK